MLPALLHHECAGVRASAARFASAAAELLSPAEAYTFLRPRLLPALSREPASLSDPAAIVACLPERGVGASPQGLPVKSRPREEKAQAGSAANQESPLLLVPSNAPVYSVKLRQAAIIPGDSALTAALASEDNAEQARTAAWLFSLKGRHGWG